MVGFILAEGPGRGFPAEDVDAVFDDGGCDPAPGRRKVSLARPPIGCGVVFLGDAEVLAVLAVQPATDRAEAAGQWGELVASGGNRILFFNGWRDEREARLKASDHVDLATDGGDRHFGALEQGRRLGDPSALRRGPYGSGDRRESSCKKKSGEGDARHGAIIIATWRGSLCLVRPCGRCAHRSAGAADRSAA